MRRKELAEERRERADNLEAPSADDSFRELLPLAIHMGTPTTSSPPFLFDPYLRLCVPPSLQPTSQPKKQNPLQFHGEGFSLFFSQLSTLNSQLHSPSSDDGVDTIPPSPIQFRQRNHWLREQGLGRSQH